jgi:outer membrane protease
MKNVYAHTVKNITVFQLLVIISVGLHLGGLFPPTLWGQTGGGSETGGSFTFSVSPLTGFLYGHGEEIVYQSEKGGAYLSELLWDIKPLVYSGAVLDVSWKNNPGFFCSVSLKFGFPMETGFMEDRDWLAWNGALSHYSRHDSKAGEAWFCDFLGGISLPFGSRVLFKPFLGLSYTHLEWIASDGYTKYGKRDSSYSYLPLEDSDRENPLSGRVAGYTQKWLILLSGASLSYTFHPRFSASLSLRLSPFLYFTGADEHYITGTDFYDYIIGGFYLEPGGDVVFRFNKWFSAGLYVSWRYMKGSPPGTSYSQETGDRLYRGSIAGAAWQTLDSGLRLSLSF